MKSKYLIYAAIILLTAGIVLSALEVMSVLALLLIITGILLKLTYLIINKLNRSYKPGYELLILLVGLVLFFVGKYSDIDFISQYATVFIFAGIFCKITFVLLFLFKKRNS